MLRLALGFLLIQLVPDRRLFLLLDRFGGELLEGGGHDINVPSLEEDKIAGRLNGNVFLERKVQTVFAGGPLKGFDVAVRHFDVGDGGILAGELGLCSMVNVSKSLLNVVSGNQAKVADKPEPKGMQSDVLL